jgi:UDP-3-O-[3-hydroxymyristoyl] glucosamine N-acyltransferase
MSLTIQNLAVLCSATVCGNEAEKVIDSAADIMSAQAHQVTVLSDLKYAKHLKDSQAAACFISENFLASDAPVHLALLRCADPEISFLTALKFLYPEQEIERFISPQSVVHQSVILGTNVHIAAFSTVGKNSEIGDESEVFSGVHIGVNVSIGQNCRIYPQVVIYDNTQIGNNVIIHSGAIIGGDGFGFVKSTEGSYKKVSQIGNVIIEDDVEIGSNTTIDRATMGSTIIRKGVKLDNLIQIAHNVEIGANTVIAAQTGISGSTKIGENCIIGGQVGIVGHISIANGSNIGAKSGVNNTIKEENMSWNGVPLTSFRDSLKVQVVTRRLPDLEKRIEELENIIKERLV